MRWVASLDNCKVILSGMTTEEQVEDNLATFSHLEPLNEAELAVVDEVRRGDSGAGICQLHGLSILHALSVWGGYPAQFPNDEPVCDVQQRVFP